MSECTLELGNGGKITINQDGIDLNYITVTPTEGRQLDLKETVSSIRMDNEEVIYFIKWLLNNFWIP